MKVITKQIARACRVHQELRDEAIKQLKAHDGFSFEAVMKATQYDAMEVAIRWDYIAEFICDDVTVKLVPVARYYFHKHKYEEECVNPGKFTVGSGGNKKVAGYVWPSDRTKHLVQHYMNVRCNQLAGAFKSYGNARNRVVGRLQEGAVLPDLEMSVHRRGVPAIV